MTKMYKEGFVIKKTISQTDYILQYNIVIFTQTGLKI